MLKIYVYYLSAESSMQGAVDYIQLQNKTPQEKRNHHFYTDQYLQSLCLYSYSAIANPELLQNSSQRACKTQNLLQ